MNTTQEKVGSIKKILAAIDGSESAAQALQLACKVASKLKAELTVAYVAVPLAYGPELNAEVVATAHREERRWGERVLRDAVTTACEAGVKVKSVVLDGGSAAQTIADFAVTNGYDLVVVGSRGRGAVSRVLLGSVSNRLVHICKTPVLVAH